MAAAVAADGAAGAIYGQTPPLVNPSKRPGEWQTYDIVFESPRWDEKGTLVKKANVTLFFNGVVVHNRREIEGRTSANFRATYGPAHPPEMFIELQDHSNPVRFRNIWVRRLGEYDRQRQAQLTRTLEEFLRQRGNISATAQALYVHPNTLRQRLRRIEELTGISIKGDDWLMIEIALKLIRLEEALGPARR